MKTLLYFASLLSMSCAYRSIQKQQVFDVHIHGTNDLGAQMNALKKAGVYKAAISSSWNLQNDYRGKSTIDLLFGIMLPCPNGKVPYSLQPCFANGQDWPTLEWTEQQIKNNKIDFIGEVLSEYYGISSSDSLLFRYYALAEKYSLPVGIHTGAAGPDHGSPNFKIEMGNPLLLTDALNRFPGLKVWIMHSGDQYYKETVTIMNRYKQVYADISVISNPDIVPTQQFKTIIKTFVEAGLEDRLMFGTDNGNIEKIMASIDGLDFLNKDQKNKIYYQNAERFFAPKRTKKSF